MCSRGKVLSYQLDFPLLARCVHWVCVGPECAVFDYSRRPLILLREDLDDVPVAPSAKPDGCIPRPSLVCACEVGLSQDFPCEEVRSPIVHLHLSVCDGVWVMLTLPWTELVFMGARSMEHVGTNRASDALRVST